MRAPSADALPAVKFLDKADATSAPAGAINETAFYCRCNYAAGVGGELGFSVNESSEGRVELVLGQEGVAPRIVQ